MLLRNSLQVVFVYAATAFIPNDDCTTYFFDVIQSAGIRQTVN